MTVGWSAINQIADYVIITVGIAVLIIRQFIWRSAELHRMLRLPALIIGAGIAYLVFEVWGGFAWVPADWLIVAELGLVAITGTSGEPTAGCNTDSPGPASSCGRSSSRSASVTSSWPALSARIWPTPPDSSCCPSG